MSASLSLFRIEFRRSVGLPLFMLLVGLAWVASNYWVGTDSDVTLWTATSAKIGLAVVLLGPAAGGLCAWAAGRDRRRRIEELLATTPFPATRRDLANWGGSTAWVGIAYAVSAVWFAAVAYREATWGGPRWWPIVLGGVALFAYAAIGFALGAYLGRVLPSSLAAALVSILLMVAQILPGSSSTQTIQDGIAYTQDPATQHLSALELMGDTAGEVFYSSPFRLSLFAVIWLLGLGALGLSAAALRRGRDTTIWMALGASVAVVITAAIALMTTEARTAENVEFVAYTPVCVERAIPVCVHPAYEQALDQSADVVERLMRPLIGVPGAPTRAEQAPGGDRSLPDGTLPFALVGEEVDLAIESRLLARELVWPLPPKSGDIKSEPPSQLAPFTPAQAAIAVWLLRQAQLNDNLVEWFWLVSEPMTPEEQAEVETGIMAAVDRFSALSEAEQHAWLVANFAALKSGQLTLDDLP